MKCPSCNKFAALDSSAEPEVNLDVESELDIQEGEGPESERPSNVNKATATVSGNVRIVLTSECCGDEMKETTFDVDVSCELERAEGCECELTELSVEASAETTDRQESSKPKTYVRGPKKGQTVQVPIPYRFQKRFYGASLEITVSCTCGNTKETVSWADECQASHMDEMN
jgi:hypothetical protein